MTDPFGMGSGTSLPGITIQHQISQPRVAMERALAAYRNNIVLPDVHVADRNEDYKPLVVGEDGVAMSPERRRQMMHEAGIKPMIDEDGQIVDQDCTQAFDEVIEQERFGESAEGNRGNMRIIRPRELELLTDVDEDTLRSTEGETYVPEVDPDAETRELPVLEDPENE